MIVGAGKVTTLVVATGDGYKECKGKRQLPAEESLKVKWLENVLIRGFDRIEYPRFRKRLPYRRWTGRIHNINCLRFVRHSCCQRHERCWCCKHSGWSTFSPILVETVDALNWVGADEQKGKDEEEASCEKDREPVPVKLLKFLLNELKFSPDVLL